jgi:hypothetical protein
LEIARHGIDPRAANSSAKAFVPVDKLAMDLTSQRIDHGYLKVLIVGKALVVKVLSDHSTMRNRLCVCVELNSNPVSHWNAVFHVKVKFLHSPQPWFVLFVSQFLFLSNARNETAIWRR